MMCLRIPSYYYIIIIVIINIIIIIIIVNGRLIKTIYFGSRC